MDELLEVGIDVLTIVNIQHLESLNDVVSGITGVQARETVPDPFSDVADDMVLVDLPSNDLRQRLNEGKVYIDGQAERAIENFFRKGNLIALRELALRRTADRADEQMRAWHDRQGQEKAWHTCDAILPCIGHSTGSEKPVRAAARLAARLGSVWHAVYVETPSLHRLPKARRRAILVALRLAQELGAETTTLSDPSEEKAALHYAREHNLGKTVIGRQRKRRRWDCSGLADRLARHASDLDLVVIAFGEKPSPPPARANDSRTTLERWRLQLRGCAVAVTLCAITILVAMQWLMAFEAANLAMFCLLRVVTIALVYDRWPSVLATVINVISFDLFSVAPRGTLAVSDVRYLLIFGVMLTMDPPIGNLTVGVRYQAQVARYRERRTRRLYEMFKALAVSRSQQDIATTSERLIASTSQVRNQLLLPDAQGKLLPLTHQSGLTVWDDAIARWSLDKGQPAGAGIDILPGVPYQILLLKSAVRTQGLLVMEPENLCQLMIPEQQRLLETFTLLVASALERLTLTASEEQARLTSERESLRNSLLAALSHDLRAPLTALFGQAEILVLDLASEGSKHALQANEIRQHVLNITRLVNNLLGTVRIQSGGFNLHKEWLTLEEAAGSALHMLEPSLGDQHVQSDFLGPLQLAHVDGPLFERVLINLLGSAHKYAGARANIGVRIETDARQLSLGVWDNGSGTPASQEQAIFDESVRGNKESAIPGVGLGLAICQAIVGVHGRTIPASNRPEGGASFRVILPGETPPELEELPGEL